MLLSAQVTEWLVNRVAPGKQLVLGSYVYLDGALFTRVAVATDAITATVLQRRGPWGRGQGGVALAHLCSPTEVHFVPAAARAAAMKRYSDVGVNTLWEKPVEVLSRGRYLERNQATEVKCGLGKDSGRHLYVQDSIVWSQVHVGFFMSHLGVFVCPVVPFLPFAFGNLQ